MGLKEQRKRFIKLTKKQLIGTDLKDSLLIGQKPLDRFFTGFLSPISEGIDDEVESEEYSSVEDDAKEEAKSEKKAKRYIPPSSAGFSFFITGDNINLRVFYNAVQYNSVSERDKLNQKFVSQSWEKNYLGDDGKEVAFSLNSVKQYKIFDGKAKIDALWRPYHDGYIVTITMSNNQKINNTESGKKYIQEQNIKTLFEIEFRCIVELGNIDVYPSKDKSLLSDEEKEIELRYKDLHIYAVGHGTAADWKRNKQDKMEIWTDFLPTVEVPQVTADTGGKSDEVLEFDFLRNCGGDDNVIHKLANFVKDYETWISNQDIKGK